MVYHFRPEEGAPSRDAQAIEALFATDGGKSHPYMAGHIFAGGRETGRDLADAVHFVAQLHGYQPGVIALAEERPAERGVRTWLRVAIEAFREERAYLTQVVVAAGPMPSTAGQAESEAAVAQARHAIEMLARSERNGCAIGAAMALVLDWRPIRAVIDATAQRFGVALAPPALPSTRQTLRLIEEAGSASVARAMTFGAQQLLAQHRGLWDLLEARARARIGT